jgi:predicted RNA polymerase sigma factor
MNTVVGSVAMTATDPIRTVEAVWRIESARIIATLTRIVRDVGIAEELAQDTMVIALEQWPRDGIPAEPGPWLMATAKRQLLRIDDVAADQVDRPVPPGALDRGTLGAHPASARRSEHRRDRTLLPRTEHKAG